MGRGYPPVIETVGGGGSVLLSPATDNIKEMK
jgi:hypothetical protein